MFRQDKAEHDEYYDIPRYLGLSVEQGELASHILNRANGLVRDGVSPSTAAALQEMGNRGIFSEDDIELAFIAQRVGTNPERRVYRQENPDFARWYSDAPFTFYEVSEEAPSAEEAPAPEDGAADAIPESFWGDGGVDNGVANTETESDTIPESFWGEE